MQVERVDEFDEVLDEAQEAIVICGITFSPSDILAELDPIAYNMYAGEYISGIEEDEEEE